MTSVKQIDDLLSGIAPKTLSESWDNDGIMLCKDTSCQVKRVLCALEVRDETARFAAQNGFDLIITHHPFIFRPISHIDEENYAAIETLMRNDISVLSYHTRLDSAKGGVNDCIAEKLGLCSVMGFGGETGLIGRIGSLEKPQSPEEFGKSLLTQFDCINIRASLGERQIKNVAVVGGAGKDFVFEALSAGADAFVTSEIPHHIFIASQKSGISLYDCGHYYTENVVVDKINSIVTSAFAELEVQSYDVKSPYTCIQ